MYRLTVPIQLFNPALLEFNTYPAGTLFFVQWPVEQKFLDASLYVPKEHDRIILFQYELPHLMALVKLSSFHKVFEYVPDPKIT